MSEKKEKHIHKVIRVDFKTGYQAFKCTLPDCSFIIATGLFVSREGLCWVCNQPFNFLPRNIKQRRPKCLNCSQKWGRKENKVSKEELDAFENLILGSPEGGD